MTQALKRFFSYLFILTTVGYLPAKAQNILPLSKEFNKILYTDVVTAEGFTAKKLFNNAKSWFALNTAGNYPMEITSENAEQNTIYGRGGFMIPSKSRRIECIYSIKLFIKEGKYKYEITDLILYHNIAASSQSGGFSYFSKSQNNEAQSFEYSLETFYPTRLTDEKLPEIKYFEGINIDVFKSIDNQIKSVIGSLALEIKRNNDW